MATLHLPCHQANPNRLIHINIHKRASPSPTTVKSFGRSDFEAFSKRVASGEAWNDVWRSANDRFEVLVYEAKKTAERIDRRYEVSVRFGSAARLGSDKAREIDREFEIGQKWRELSLHFVQNWPRYRKQLNDFADTPLGRTFVTIFLFWFALSGWMFRFLIFATCILPFAGPFLLRIVANNFIIKALIYSDNVCSKIANIYCLKLDLIRGIAQLVRGSLLVTRAKQFDARAVEISYGCQKRISIPGEVKTPILQKADLILSMLSLRKNEEVTKSLSYTQVKMLITEI